MIVKEKPNSSRPSDLRKLQQKQKAKEQKENNTQNYKPTPL